MVVIKLRFLAEALEKTWFYGCDFSGFNAHVR
jgi:hypothetical protein